MAELNSEEAREAVKPLFRWMHQNNVDSVTLTRKGGECRLSANVSGELNLTEKPAIGFGRPGQRE